MKVPDPEYKFDWFTRITAKKAEKTKKTSIFDLFNIEKKEETIQKHQKLEKQEKQKSKAFNELLKSIHDSSLICITDSERYEIIEKKLLEIEDILEDYKDELSDPDNYAKIRNDIYNAVKIYSNEIKKKDTDKFIDESILLDVIRYDYVLKIISDMIKQSKSKRLLNLRNSIRNELHEKFNKDEKLKLLTRLHNLCSIQIIDLLQKRRKSSVKN